jgi:hypothetical protein
MEPNSGLGCMGGGGGGYVVGAAVEGKRSARLAVHAASVTKAKRLQTQSGYKHKAERRMRDRRTRSGRKKERR